MTRRRGLGVLLLVASLLVCVNACDAESNAGAVFRSAEYVSSDVEPVIAQRHADELGHLELEGAALGLAGLALMLVFAPLRRRNRQ